MKLQRIVQRALSFARTPRIKPESSALPAPRRAPVDLAPSRTRSRLSPPRRTPPRTPTTRTSACSTHHTRPHRRRRRRSARHSRHVVVVVVVVVVVAARAAATRLHAATTRTARADPPRAPARARPARRLAFFFVPRDRPSSALARRRPVVASDECIDSFVWAFSEAPLCRAPRRIPSHPAPQSATRASSTRARGDRRDASDASATRVRREPSTGRARRRRARDATRETTPATRRRRDDPRRRWRARDDATTTRRRWTKKPTCAG